MFCIQNNHSIHIKDHNLKRINVLIDSIIYYSISFSRLKTTFKNIKNTLLINTLKLKSCN